MSKAEWQMFGEWVDTLRKRAGLQNRQLAEKAGVSLQWLQSLRKGGRLTYGKWQPPNPKDEALVRLAKALDVPVEEMSTRVNQARSATFGGEASPDEGAERRPATDEVDAERFLKLEEQVAQHERDLTELRQLLLSGLDEQGEELPEFLELKKRVMRLRQHLEDEKEEPARRADAR